MDRKLIDIYDFAEIVPVIGAKRKICLKRTRYKVNISKSNSFKVDGDRIFLPSVEEGDRNLEIFLDQKGKEKFFCVKADGESTFSLSGVRTNYAELSHLNVLKILYNKIKFFKKVKSAKNETFLVDEKIINSNLPILIQGETGVGKTRLAYEIHERSNRIGKFVHVNIASFSSSLVESELFGHVKGAFTGAFCEKKGAFLEADRGTLFLDEVDSLSMAIQTKLLLFLDDFKVRKVGGSYSKKTDIRIIFSTGKSLKSLVDKGEMRKDFFYRLKNGFLVNLLPLRDNSVEIEKVLVKELDRFGKYPCKSLVSYYKSLNWPGNYRQLISHIKKKVSLCEGDMITIDDLDLSLEQESNLIDESENVSWMSLNKVKENYIVRAYQYFGANTLKTANALDVTPNTIRNILKKCS